MSDHQSKPLTPEQRALIESIPVLPNPIMSIDDRMDLAHKLKRLEEREQQLAAISAALDKEFDPAKGDIRSGDLIDDVECFIRHHKEKEQQLLACEASRERMRELLGQFEFSKFGEVIAWPNPESVRDALAALPQTALTEALKLVRIDLQKIEAFTNVEGSVVHQIAQRALSELDKLCPINPAPSRDCQSSSSAGIPMPEGAAKLSEEAPPTGQ